MVKPTLVNVAFGYDSADKNRKAIGKVFAKNNNTPLTYDQIAKLIRASADDVIGSVMTLVHDFKVIQELPAKESEVKHLKNRKVRISPKIRVVPELVEELKRLHSKA
ncbi:MAG: hypothetical protein ACREBF_00755 [Candidatus Micrarchaeales archaeon]